MSTLESVLAELQSLSSNLRSDQRVRLRSSGHELVADRAVAEKAGAIADELDPIIEHFEQVRDQLNTKLVEVREQAVRLLSYRPDPGYSAPCRDEG